MPSLRSLLRNILPQERDIPRLDRGWIIANHKLVSFHAAFLTSLLSISTSVASRFDVVRQMFLSAEVLISAVMWYVAWHTNIAIHEIGHYLAAVRTNNLRPELAGPAQQKLNQGGAARWAWYLEMFAKIPYGSFAGVNKEAGSFHPSVKTQNLAVSAVGPRAGLTLSHSTLPLGFVLGALGLLRGGSLGEYAVYAGRLFFTVGVVAMFDFLIADPGKYKAYLAREREAAARAAEVKAAEPARAADARAGNPSELRRKLRLHRLQEVELEDGTIVFAPWEFRNSIMGGRHTEEMGGNLSFQEFMFLPLTARDYIEAAREIKALIGGRDYAESQLNRVTALRQPGSSFKPFVYAAAFNAAIKNGSPKLTPATHLTDEPTTFWTGKQPYTPGNFGNAFYGDVTVRQALAKSQTQSKKKMSLEDLFAKAKTGMMTKATQGCSACSSRSAGEAASSATWGVPRWMPRRRAYRSPTTSRKIRFI